MVATTLPFSMSHFPTTCLLQLSHWHLPSLLCDKLGCKPMFLLAIVCFATAMPQSLVLIDSNKWGIIIPIKVGKNPLFSSMMPLAIASSAFLHWDHLEECTYLVLVRHARCHTGNGPFLNDVDLLVELSAMLVSVPLASFALILHLGDDLAGLITLLASSVGAHKMFPAGKVSLAVTLESLALLGNKIALTQGILECNSC